MCTDRIIVHHSLAVELAERLTAVADQMSVGDPRLDATELGPLIHLRAARSFRDLVLDALDHGAEILAAGPELDGLYARPTVLKDLPRSARLYHQENFSPVVSIHPVTDDQEALIVANDTDYGLVGSVIAQDPARAEALAAGLHAGAVHVNGPSVGDEPHVAFGGLGASGYGRLSGMESVRAFTDQRTFYLHRRITGSPSQVLICRWYDSQIRTWTSRCLLTFQVWPGATCTTYGCLRRRGRSGKLSRVSCDDLAGGWTAAC